MEAIVYSGPVSLDFGTVPAGQSVTQTVGVPGAVPGEPVVLGLPPSSYGGPIQYSALCTTADTLAVVAYNPTAANVVTSAEQFTIAQLTF